MHGIFGGGYLDKLYNASEEEIVVATILLDNKNVTWSKLSFNEKSAQIKDAYDEARVIVNALKKIGYEIEHKEPKKGWFSWLR